VGLLPNICEIILRPLKIPFIFTAIAEAFHTQKNSCTSGKCTIRLAVFLFHFRSLKQIPRSHAMLNKRLLFKV
jgi:hypothetical protein